MQRTPFTPTQLAILVAEGAVLWLAAALLLRWLAPMGIYEGNARIWLYLLVIPGTVPFILGCIRLAGLPRAHAALGISIATMAAMFLDGIALAWFPGLYGSSVEHTAGAGAVILWGAAVGIAVALAVNRAD